ncbi:MAG TPA: hypothetical protein VFI27_19850 [candidate division Zixibacteria bacterium]|nr:hypothetical protein [candidate division Zixibacteria bacterium]
MNKRFHWQVFPGIFLILLACFLISPSVAAAQEEGKVQVFEGNVVIDGGLIYNLDGLLEGDRLIVLVEPTSGNLDPIVGLARTGLEAGRLRAQYRSDVEQAIARGEDPLVAIPAILDETFLAWNDDGGEGYDSLLDFTIPESGDYQLVLTGSPIVDSFGEFHMVIGLNHPEVITGNTRPTGDVIAVIDHDASQIGEAVQEVTGSLSDTNSSTFYILRKFQPGDTLYVYIEATSGDLIPRIFLDDFGGKPIRSGNFSGTEREAAFEYTFEDDAGNFRISIEACCEDGEATQGDYRLLVGADSPSVLSGKAEAVGQPILLEPLLAHVGLQLQQITHVDQKAENFGVVAELEMQWNDPALAFSPDTCQCDYRIFYGEDFLDFALENEIVWPEITLTNQQGRRFTQNQFVVVRPSGDASYFERFTAELQAPDFDFRRFPFDEQVFYIRVESLFPEEYVVLSELEGGSVVGDQLGEEEWSITESGTEIASENGRSRFSFRFTAERHLNFYIFRIFLPILIILVVSWTTFFLKDYGKRVDVAGANLLLFIAFNFTISDELPRLGYLTFLDTILISTFVITGFVLILNVILKRLEISGKEELAQRLDRYMVWIYPISYVIAVFTVSVLFT